MRCSFIVVCLAAIAVSGAVAKDDELCLATKQCVLMNGTKCDRSTNPANCPNCLTLTIGGAMPLCTNPTFDGCPKGSICEDAVSNPPTTTKPKPSTTNTKPNPTPTKPSPSTTAAQPATEDPTEAPTEVPTTTTAKTTTKAPTTTVASPSNSLATSALCAFLIVAVSCIV